MEAFFLKCNKGEKYYILEGSNSDALTVLYIFLSDDFIASPEWFRSWAMGTTSGTGGNVTFVDRDNNDIIVTLDPVVYGTDIPFKVSQKDFLTILNTWEKLYREGWKEITITQDGSGVHMEGKNE